MKKLLIVGLLSLAMNSSFADDSSSGCGLGWMLLKKNSLISSFTRTFINATFSNTIGMTLGTSGCTQHSIVKVEKLQEHFTETNYHALMAEMSQGEGMFLRAYSEVLGCGEQNFGSFSKVLQNNYQRIYTHGNVTPSEVLNNVKKEINSSSSLSSACNTALI